MFDKLSDSEDNSVAELDKALNGYDLKHLYLVSDTLHTDKKFVGIDF